MYIYVLTGLVVLGALGLQNRGKCFWRRGALKHGRCCAATRQHCEETYVSVKAEFLSNTGIDYTWRRESEAVYLVKKFASTG